MKTSLIIVGYAVSVYVAFFIICFLGHNEAYENDSDTILYAITALFWPIVVAFFVVMAVVLGPFYGLSMAANAAARRFDRRRK